MVHPSVYTPAFVVVSGLISAGLFVFAVRAYLARRDPTLGFVAAAFGTFAAKNFLVGYTLQFGLLNFFDIGIIDAVADLAAIVLFAVPIFLPRS